MQEKMELNMEVRVLKVSKPKMSHMSKVEQLESEGVVVSGRTEYNDINRIGNNRQLIPREQSSKVKFQLSPSITYSRSLESES